MARPWVGLEVFLVAEPVFLHISFSFGISLRHLVVHPNAIGDADNHDEA
jgi:hypothetical protein